MVGIISVHQSYTNQQYDKESGLYYYNARYYDPHLGSFITPDPSMSGLNHYAYSINPVIYTDPTGLAIDYRPGEVYDTEDPSIITNTETGITTITNDDGSIITCIFWDWNDMSGQLITEYENTLNKDENKKDDQK